MPNYNEKTGIPFGIIAMNSLDQDLAQDLWYQYGTNLSYEEALVELKKEVEGEADDIEEEAAVALREIDYLISNDPAYEGLLEARIEDAYSRLGFNDREDFIDTKVEQESQSIEIDEPTIEGEYEGVKYVISWLGGAPLLWCIESPVIGSYQECSPCIPGGGDLDGQDRGYTCYDVPKDWRAKEYLPEPPALVEVTPC